MDPEEKAGICQPELRPEEEDQLGALQVLNSFTGFEGTEINKTSETGSYLTGELRSDAHAHPTEQAGKCTKQTNPLADFRAVKLTCKGTDHSSRDYISNTKERSAIKTNTIGEGGNTTQGSPASQATNDLPTKASEKKTSLKFGGNTTRGGPASQVADDPFTDQSEPKTNTIGEGGNTTRSSSASRAAHDPPLQLSAFLPSYNVIQSVSTTPFSCSGSLLYVVCPFPPRQSWETREAPSWWLINICLM